MTAATDFPTIAGMDQDARRTKGRESQHNQRQDGSCEQAKHGHQE